MQKRLMKFLRSMTFGMILLGLILLCSFPGSVIAQGNTPDWYVQTYPDWHGVILKLGLDDVFGSWYFITLLALLCLNLTLCSLIRIRNVVKASKKAAASAAERKTKVFLSAEGTSQLRQLLEERHYKKEVFGETTVYSKNSIGWYGSFVTHLAILLTVLFGAAALYLPKVTNQTCFPTTVFVDSEGRILTYPIVGAAVEQYEPTVEALLAGESADVVTGTGAVANGDNKYCVYVYDTDGNPVEGAFIQFCDDATCAFQPTDANGLAEFRVDVEKVYEVHVVQAPEGFRQDERSYETLDSYSDVNIFLEKAE